MTCVARSRIVLVGAALSAAVVVTTGAASRSSHAAGVAMVSRCLPRSLPFSSTVDLGGTWSGDDGAIMYLTQSGVDVWWVSMSGRGGPSAAIGREFTNVGHGTRNSGGTIDARWIDTPRGQVFETHTARIAFKIADRGGTAALERVSATGGYGGKIFTPCVESRP